MHNNVVEQRDYNNPRAPVYVVAGGAGNDESRLTPSSKTTSMHQSRRSLHSVHDESRVREGDADYVAAKSFHYSSGVLHVVNDTTLNFRLVSSSDGSTLDEFTITKGRMGTMPRSLSKK